MFKKFRRKPVPQPFRESALAHKYLDGLNGIEIGGSVQNSFGLERTGAYANVDFEFTQGGKWQDSAFPPKAVNIVANGDDLPFRDNSLDYVISSHVIEHFFDPVKTIGEWLRVVKQGGIVFIIVPHKERTFDKLRPVTPLDELQRRHTGKLKISDYRVMTENNGFLPGNEVLDENYQSIVTSGGMMYDDHHHWSVFVLENFVEMCRAFGFNIIETQDPDDKVTNGFTVVLKKQTIIV